MTLALISASHEAMIIHKAGETIEINSKFSTLRISDEQLRAYINDQLSLDEETGARGAVGVRPIELAANLLKTMLLTTHIDFDKLIAHTIENSLWSIIRLQLPT